MTNTREEVAVAEAIGNNLTPQDCSAMAIHSCLERAAKAAIAASNSQYLPQLVAALKRVLNRAMVHDHEGYEQIAKEALNNLPDEVKQ